VHAEIGVGVFFPPSNRFHQSWRNPEVVVILMSFSPVSQYVLEIK
jgi:hypothetical protein